MPPFDYVKARSQESLGSSSSSSSSKQQQQQNADATTATTTTTSTTSCFVDGYPYLWQCRVDATDEQSIKDVCVQIFGQIAAAAEEAETTKMTHYEDDDASLLQVQRISGGVTNILFKVSGLHNIFQTISNNNNNINNTTGASTGVGVLPNDVLVRIFGAEGMIDRDDETYSFSYLAQHGIAPPYFGRFQNGRLEGWMHDMRALETADLHCDDSDDGGDNATATLIQAGIARALAQLHATNVPTTTTTLPFLDGGDGGTKQQDNDQKEPTLWKQLEEWYQQACSNVSYKTQNDEQRARDIDLVQYRAELNWLRHDIEQSPHLRVAFCHNDLLAANILYKSGGNDGNDDDVPTIQLIDFEYGGWNYISFDIANHWNEHAGGPPDSPHPNYDKMLPNAAQRRRFCRAYLLETEKLLLQQQQDAANAADTSVTEDHVSELVAQVEKFLMPNHLYWGFWAVNQAATEGCDGYDYLEFAKSRLAQYWLCKQEIAQNSSISASGRGRSAGGA
jgi:Choline/ethanolamine kinase